MSRQNYLISNQFILSKFLNLKNQFNIATGNLCLGFSNKKDYVERVMNENSIDICCMQEVEIGTNIDTSLLSIINYSLLLENNELKVLDL